MSGDEDEPDVQGENILVRSSIIRDDPPASGPRPSPYRWTGVVETDSPDTRTRSVGAYVVYHEMEVDPRVRVAHTTRVDVFPDDDGEPPHDGSVLVEAQISVHKQGLLKSVDKARESTRSKRNHWRRVVEERSDPTRGEEPGPGRVRLAARKVADTPVRGFARIAAAFWAAVTVLLEIPNRIFAHSLEAYAVLHSHLGRRGVLEGLTNPRDSTVTQRGVTVFVVGVAGLLFVLLLNSMFALIFPAYAAVYRYTLGLSMSMVSGVLFFPVVVEPLLVFAMLAVGPVPAFTGLLIGKLVGAWILYLIGVSLVDTVREWAELSKKVDESIDWMMETADDYAFPLLFVGNLAPFVSGFFLYVYAVAGVRFRDWVAGVGLGTALRFGIIILAVVIVGPDAVSAWLSAWNPLA